MNLPYSPHDLLPIKNPLTNEPEGQLFFYNNVVKHLVPDIVRMMSVGIPIDLSKVAELEDTVDDVLAKVQDKLRNNPIMKEFMEEVANLHKKDKTEQIEQKRKTVEDFIKPFDPKNKIHRTYVVNFYLKDRPDLQMEEWSIKDLKKLNQILSSQFIQNIIDKADMSENCLQWMRNQIELGMLQLAQDKCDAYNKNKVQAKIENLETKDLMLLFNPGSSVQKQHFFEFMDIPSDTKTDAGNDSWNRKELERIQKLLAIMIDSKEDIKEIQDES